MGSVKQKRPLPNMAKVLLSTISSYHANKAGGINPRIDDFVLGRTLTLLPFEKEHFISL